MLFLNSPSTVHIEDLLNGTYQFSYTLEQSGEYLLEIDIDEVPVHGSPFGIHCRWGENINGILLIAARRFANTCHYYYWSLSHWSNYHRRCFSLGVSNKNQKEAFVHTSSRPQGINWSQNYSECFFFLSFFSSFLLLAIRTSFSCSFCC